MKLEFTKMQGAGNDYIYINCLKEEISSPELLAIKLSDRHYGIGGDGIVLICKSNKADAKMRMFNLDGSEGKMCGNAIRCVAKYLYDNHIVSKDSIKIETLSGIKELSLNLENNSVFSVKVNMGKAILKPSEIPVKLDDEKIINKAIKIGGKDYNITCVSMGNPHCVVFCNEVDDIDLPKIGKEFEFNDIFPEKVNTEFIKVIDDHTLKMRVWERGSGETLACGTGSCAAAVAAVLNGYCKKGDDIRVILLGGELIINYNDDAVYMTGECKKVFEGVIEV